MQSQFLPKINTSAYLIAGPTASGKSDFALRLAKQVNGAIINTDALQVYAQWYILSARPTPNDLAQASHHLYGHIPLLHDYSVGHWLREVEVILPKIRAKGRVPIFVGGTGLYFDALLTGLADIPAIRPATKQAADDLERQSGKTAFGDALARLDAKTYAQIDVRNPARARRAWEVFCETGKGLSDWQAQTPPPLLDKAKCQCIAVHSDTDWLNARIDRRFEQMIKQGALAECQAVFDEGLWQAQHPSCRAIGAAELIAHLQGDMTLDNAITAASQATRRYAKRQRTWLRNKMTDWQVLNCPL